MLAMTSDAPTHAGKRVTSNILPDNLKWHFFKKFGKLPNVIMPSVIWANQKTKSFFAGYAHMQMFDVTCFSAFVWASDINLSFLFCDRGYHLRLQFVNPKSFVAKSAPDKCIPYMVIQHFTPPCRRCTWFVTAFYRTPAPILTQFHVFHTW